jgi:hypothetical protein
MTKNEFKQAVEKAKTGNYDKDADYNNLIGFGLPEFKAVPTTLDAVARMINYQSAQFDGNWDMSAMAEVFAFKNKFQIIG